MGFYIRKSFSVGPVRLNLSRSGLGASFGVKGARIGVGPRGTYVHMGRGGLYYRQTLAPHTHSMPRGIPEGVRKPSNLSNFQPIGSGAAIEMCDSSAATLLSELNRVRARTDLLPIAAALGGILLIAMASAQAPWWALLICGSAITAIALGLRHLDVTNGTAFLEYAIEGDAVQSFGKLQGSFGELGACQMISHVDAAAQTDDWKRNAGVNRLTKEPNAKCSHHVRRRCNAISLCRCWWRATNVSTFFRTVFWFTTPGVLAQSRTPTCTHRQDKRDLSRTAQFLLTRRWSERGGDM
jgi:hypothetical protein